MGVPGCVFDQFITDAAAVKKADGVPDAYVARVFSHRGHVLSASR